tara:strand:+ start:1385 stop:2329 length:945 start_codon:yes stop_codon:yes gene_type:complete
MMAHIDLCSGIGGFALGLERSGLSKPVLFCELDGWCRKILKKHWPDVPQEKDVKELANDPTTIIRAVGDRRSILTSGYPCQPFSYASAQRRGSDDDRHIWPQVFSIIKQVEPDWIILENVSGHITLGLDKVLSDLEDKADYQVQTFHIGAVSVDAPHRRMRIWVVGHAGHKFSKSRRHTEARKKTVWSEEACEYQRSSQNVADTSQLYGNVSAKHTEQGERQEPQFRDSGSAVNVADADSARLQGKKWSWTPRAQGQSSRYIAECGGQNWLTEPAVGRVANGVRNRVDRLRGLGNAVVPAIPERFGRIIKEIEA